MRLYLLLYCLVFLSSLIGLSQSVPEQRGNESQKKSNSNVILGGKKNHENHNLNLVLRVSDVSKFESWINKKGWASRLVKRKNYGVVELSLKGSHYLDSLRSHPFVIAIDSYRQPREESLVRFHDLNQNGISTAQQSFGFHGIAVLVKERAFDIEDIDISSRAFLTELADTIVTRHATDMATLIAGMGNSFESGQGVSSSIVYSTSFNNLLPEPPAFYEDLEIKVINHSYGVGIENYYGIESEAYDASSYDHLHVFSSGNQGLESDSANFPGISSYFNLTGSFKHAKNILVVGAVDSTGNVVPQSSAGPTIDGRIKPELVAFGGEGSSDAAALVSGSASYLYDLMDTLTIDQTLKLLLIRSLLITGANDVESIGPDYRSGFGNLDLNSSVRMLGDQNYFTGYIEPGASRVLPLNIPANVREIRIGLSWYDSPVLPGTSMTLVNDLDMMISDSLGNVHYPWILNPYPHMDSLTAPASRGNDHVNNNEMISIAEPFAGSYQIMVTNHGAEQVPFAISYQRTYNEQFEWVFPRQGTQLFSSQDYLLRWQTTYDGNGVLQLRTQDTTWITIDSALILSEEYYRYRSPSSFSTIQFRMKIGGAYFYTDTLYVQPIINPEVRIDCNEFFEINWEDYDFASHYLIHVDGNRESYILSEDTTNRMFKADYPGTYYSISPVYDNGEIGKKGLAINYAFQRSNCYVNNFESAISGNAIELNLQLYETDQIRSTYLYTIGPSGDTLILVQEQDPASEFVNAIDDLPRQGSNIYLAMAELIDSTKVYSDLNEIYFIRKNDVVVYPNPLPSLQSINVLSRGTGGSFRIFDNQGVLVFETEISETLQDFKLPSLTRGVYLYQLINEGKSEMKRGQIIIQ